MSSETTLFSGLKTLRKQQKWSQEFLAGRLGITRMAYVRYESGKSIPRVGVMRAMARLLRVQPWQFFHPDPIQAAVNMSTGAGMLPTISIDPETGFKYQIPPTVAGMPVSMPLRDDKRTRDPEKEPSAAALGSREFDRRLAEAKERGEIYTGPGRVELVNHYVAEDQQQAKEAS